MKFKSIKLLKPSNTEFINSLLEHHQPNNFLFDKCIIALYITNIQPWKVINRQFWEQVILKRTGDDLSPIRIKQITDSDAIIFISLTEALDYIEGVTPPIFKKKVNDTITSVDDVIKMLEMYLMEDNQYNVDYFLASTGFNSNATNGNYDDTRIEKIKQIHSKMNIVAVIDCSSSKSVKSSEDAKSHLQSLLTGVIDEAVQCTIEASGIPAITILKTILDSDYIRFVNLNTSESGPGPVVKATIYCSSLKSCRSLRALLKKMYL